MGLLEHQGRTGKYDGSDMQDEPMILRRKPQRYLER